MRDVKKRLSALFENRDRKARYVSLQDELAAVETGIKGMSTFSFAKDEIPTSYQYGILASEADRRRLTVVELELSNQSSTIDVLVVHPDHAWRIKAYEMLVGVLRSHPHSRLAEHLMSSILGYSRNDIEQWFLDRKERIAGDSGVTIFALLDSRSIPSLEAHGRRSFCTADGNSVLLFYNRNVGSNGGAILRPNFRSLLPDQTTLCRCAVKLSAWQVVFESEIHSEDEIIVKAVEHESLSTVNNGLLSHIEFI